MSKNGDRHADGGDFFAKLGETLGELFEQGRQELVKGAKVGRAALDRRALETDRDKLLMDIGRQAVVALREERIHDAALSDLAQRLETLEARIATFDEERKNARDPLAESDESRDTPAAAEAADHAAASGKED